MKQSVLIFLICLLAMSGKAQTNSTITLDECYRLARENYPLIRQHDLIAKARSYSIENASKLYLPQVAFSGFATYQSQTINFSEVLGNTSLPISFPTLSKDQYRVQGEINQNIYDGGTSRNQKRNAGLNADIQQQSLEVSLYALNDRVNQIYFSILLMNEQLAQNELRTTDLQSVVDKTSAALRNGTAFRSQVDELNAELSNIELSSIEFKENRKAYLQMLSIFTGSTIDENTTLAVPDETSMTVEIRRPELRLFELRKKTYDLQEAQLHSDYMPRLGLFIDGAYGRPTLNIIENKFGFWYIGGLRLSWNLGSLYTLGNNMKLLAINRQNTDVDRDVFLYNTNLTIAQENGEIRKYRKLISQDDTTIALRASVKRSAQAQVENGVITTHDFIAQVDAENLAKQTLILHRIQLLRAQYNLKNTSGN